MSGPVESCWGRATRRYPALPDATGRYPTLPDATQRYPTLPNATRRYPTLLYATRINICKFGLAINGNP
jgi:hypothetical protein